MFFKSQLVFFSTLLCFLGGAYAETTERPNILFLMADDWSYPHASALGDPVVKTPTFDRLAKEGVLFENAFASAPSCTPSRHAVSSGQYHWRLKGGANLGGSIPKETPVYPDLLAKAGYKTGFSRKGTAPSKHMFRGNDPFGKKFKNFEQFYAQRKDNEPFCFWYGAGEPHRPYDWQASKRAAMDLDKIKVPACLPDNETVRTDIGDYYMKVQQFDSDAARMIALLEKNGELDNTIIVMTSDNGMPFPRGKATLYDMGTRVPLVIRWGKKVKGDRTLTDFVSLTDLAPTFIEAAGLPAVAEMTGRSLMPHLQAQKEGHIDPRRNYVLTGMDRHVYPYPSRAIRTEDFLYIRNFAPASWPTGKITGENPHYDFVKTPWPTTQGAFSYNVDPSPTKQWMREHADAEKDANRFQLAFGQRTSEELYDLNADPEQLHNLAYDDGFAMMRSVLSKSLSRELKKFGDPHFQKDGFATFDIKGWTVHLNEIQWNNAPQATDIMLGILVQQLERVIDTVPSPALKKMREIPIWINPAYQNFRPSAEYHPGANWLRDNNRLPEMAKAVEITNVSMFPFENRRMPYLLLHELAHGYHDRELGFDQPDIVAAYKRARDSGSYDKVKRFNGRKIVMDKAYAMTNAKEYFAEITEAYFGKNDFFPFNRKELKVHDLQGYEAVEKVWGVKK